MLAEQAGHPLWAVRSAPSDSSPLPSAILPRAAFKTFPYTHDFMPLNEKSDLTGSGQGSFVTLPCSRTEKESPPTAPPGLEMLHINNAHCKGGEGNPSQGKTYHGSLTMTRVPKKGSFHPGKGSWIPVPLPALCWEGWESVGKSRDSRLCLAIAEHAHIHEGESLYHGKTPNLPSLLLARCPLGLLPTPPALRQPSSPGTCRTSPAHTWMLLHLPRLPELGGARDKQGRPRMTR